MGHLEAAKTHLPDASGSVRDLKSHGINLAYEDLVPPRERTVHYLLDAGLCQSGPIRGLSLRADCALETRLLRLDRRGGLEERLTCVFDDQISCLRPLLILAGLVSENAAREQALLCQFKVIVQLESRVSRTRPTSLLVGDRDRGWVPRLLNEGGLL